MSLKRSLKKIPILYWIGVRLHKLRDHLHSVEGANNLIRIKGDTYRLRKSIIGNNNLVEIGDGCIIGSRSLVNKKIPDSCLAVGMPARIVKEAIRWTREDVLN